MYRNAIVRNLARISFGFIAVLALAGCGGGGGQVVGPGVPGDGLVQTSGTVELGMLIDGQPVNLKEKAGQQSQGIPQIEVDPSDLLLTPGDVYILPVYSDNPSETQKPCLYLPPQRILDNVVFPSDSTLQYFNGASGRTLQASVPLSTDGTMTKGLILSEGSYRDGGKHEFRVMGTQSQFIQFRNAGDDDVVSVAMITVKFDINSDCQTSIPVSTNLILPVKGRSSAGCEATLTFDLAANGQTCTFIIVGSIRSTESGREISNGQVHIVGTGDAGIFGDIEEVTIETSLP